VHGVGMVTAREAATGLALELRELVRRYPAREVIDVSDIGDVEAVVAG